MLVDKRVTDDACFFIAFFNPLFDNPHIRSAKICDKTCITNGTLHHVIDSRILAGIAETNQITNRNCTGTGRGERAIAIQSVVHIDALAFFDDDGCTSAAHMRNDTGYFIKFFADRLRIFSRDSTDIQRMDQ